MRVFLTGGAGFIGSHVSAVLLAAGHDVTVFDNLSNGHREFVPSNAAFIEGDLADPALGGQGFFDYTVFPAAVGEYDMAAQVLTQIKAVLLTVAWSGIGSMASSTAWWSPAESTGIAGRSIPSSSPICGITPS